MPGYDAATPRDKEFTLLDGLHFDIQQGMASSGQAQAAEFGADGTLDPSSQQTLRIVDRTNAAIEIAQTSDASEYQIVDDTKAQ